MSGAGTTAGLSDASSSASAAASECGETGADGHCGAEGLSFVFGPMRYLVARYGRKPCVAEVFQGTTGMDLCEC